MSQERLDLVRGAMEAFNRRDAAGFGALLARHAEVIPVRAALEGTVYRGPGAAAQYCAAVDASWEHLTWEIDEIRDGGTWVVVLGHIRGRGLESGAVIDTSSAWVIHFQGGVATSFQTFADQAKGLESVGLRK